MRKNGMRLGFLVPCPNFGCSWNINPYVILKETSWDRSKAIVECPLCEVQWEIGNDKLQYAHAD
jgi:hypothetical protein